MALGLCCARPGSLAEVAGRASGGACREGGRVGGVGRRGAGPRRVLAQRGARGSPVASGVRGLGRATLRTRAFAAGVEGTTLVKVCGVMTKEDAAMVGEKGADFIGFIVSGGYKRSIGLEEAREIVSRVKEGGAEPVGIFTRETAEEMVRACDEIGLETVQLHGDTPRESLKDLPARLSVFYVVHSEGGRLITPLPAELAQIDLSVPDPAYWKKPIDWVSAGRRSVDYILVDKKEAGGTGKLDWDSFVVPKGCSRKGWIMAGGLTPDNVEEAVQRFRPSIVDVSGGVCDSSGLKKDPIKVEVFVTKAKAAALK
ncbi:phosphoribosylanthranilate isomerase [Chloropicon primus]|uniref:phosphoribosylanthranilate isomerase n=1 Tax=Chloropicon primus TaxID=1764295 RepID=A0A5B8MNS2_9CHLO|nr:phosphoribosylanthranilate isomerase [Chloropicon primus]UPR00865.1 phosphoribosylanthranilate isomerase [Chloropicon primus]|eukprot:QDZ21654.1 phosphoribosylanthranilate isomerase [Chloropicon primus]